ncbi:MAG: type III secretion system inner membrane ring subunit SctD [Endozoicomonas sp. (ex Botrylloides leachii)]|nr:type III secretion system inner membrane ring subunit SctD [Endozoicomonas sp. (ex Botrylloides leachii)]
MSGYYLKILSGNHLGAEIPLEPGEYSLGKGDECDLILTDDSLMDVNFTLEITAEGTLSVKTTAQQLLYLNGTPAGQTLKPDHFEVFTSNSIHFTFGPADTPWPDIEIPDLQKPEIQQTESYENDGFPDPDADDSLTEKAHENAFIEIDDYDDAGDDEKELEINSKWLIGIPAVFFLFITTFAVMLFSDGDEATPKTVISPINQAKIIKNNLSLPDIKFRELPDGTLLISGYTQTLEKREALINQVKQKQIRFRSQVIVMDRMRANAETLLKTRGYSNLNVELDNTPGSLILTGYVVSADQLDKVTNLLKQEIYGLNDIVSQVDNQAGRVKMLKAMIKDQGLASRVHLTERPGKVLAQGLLLDSVQRYKLQEVVNRFQSRYHNKPAVIIEAKESRMSQQADMTKTSIIPVVGGTGSKQALRPSVTVRGVSMGAIPYVVMADGGKYLLGSKLDNGYIIEDINLDYLLLSRGAQEIKYQLGGKSNNEKVER